MCSEAYTAYVDAPAPTGARSAHPLPCAPGRRFAALSQSQAPSIP